MLKFSRRLLFWRCSRSAPKPPAQAPLALHSPVAGKNLSALDASSVSRYSWLPGLLLSKWQPVPAGPTHLCYAASLPISDADRDTAGHARARLLGLRLPGAYRGF